MQHGIVWSLIAEIIYYLIYPLLLTLHRRFVWPRMVAVAFGLTELLGRRNCRPRVA